MAERKVVYFGGVPTGPDVRQLRERFGVPEEGAEIPYEQVEALLRVERRSPRWNAVTNAWRRGLFKEYNLLLVAGQGRFKVALPPERVDYSSAKFRTGGRMMRRSLVVVEGTDRARLSEVQKAHADHIQRTAGAILLTARLEAGKRKPVLPAPLGGRE